MSRRATIQHPTSTTEVFYAFKLGPVPAGAGSFDLYIGLRDGWIAPMVSGVSEGEALRQLAEHGKGCALQCEPQLAKAGKHHGFNSAPAPEWAIAFRCGITICMALGPSIQPDAMLPAYELAKASRKFFESAPWQHWHADLAMTFVVTGLVDRTFEGCIMGSGGSEFGVALYEEKGALEKIVKLGKAGRQKDAAQLRCIAVTFDEAPTFAREILETVIGGPVLPIPTRVEGGRMGPPSATDLLVLAAALRASAGLAPSTPIGVGGVTGAQGAVTVKVTAPAARVEGA